MIVVRLNKRKQKGFFIDFETFYEREFKTLEAAEYWRERMTKIYNCYSDTQKVTGL